MKKNSPTVLIGMTAACVRPHPAGLRSTDALHARGLSR